MYVVESSKLLRPLMTAASRACVNPNVWFYARSWSPGTLTNYASNRRLFKEAHQPNRRCGGRGVRRCAALPRHVALCDSVAVRLRVAAWLGQAGAPSPTGRAARGCRMCGMFARVQFVRTSMA